MSLQYLAGSSWRAISREERLFCAELYFCAREKPQELVALINRRCALSLDIASEWELGYEVCFYRDVLHHRRAPKRAAKLPLKRTFDLALFSSNTIVIIEAKVCEPFTAEQGYAFARDREHLATLVGPDVQVVLVALASARYFAAFNRHGLGRALEPFEERCLTWKDVHKQYGIELFEQAESVYHADPARLVKADTVPPGIVCPTADLRVVQPGAQTL